MSLFSFGNKPASAGTTPAAPQLAFSAPANPAGSTQQPTSSFSFGAPAQPSGTTGTSNPPAAGGLFGGVGAGQTAQQQPQAPGTGGSLFGSSGLFGSKPATTTTGTTGAGPFGTSSLFGGQQQQQPQQQQQQQPGQIGTGFGSSSLFGQNTQQSAQQQQPQQQTNAFGQSTTQPLFGAQGSQNVVQQSTSAAQSGMQGSTKFTDLPESHQKVFEDINTFIKQQKDKANGIDSSRIGGAIRQTSNDAQSGYRETQVLGQSHKAIAEAIKKQIAKNKEAEATLITIMTFVDAATKSADGRQTIIRPNVDRDFPSSFFIKKAAELEERVHRYKTSISQLRRAIDSLAARSDGPSPEIIGQTIQNHQDAIVTLAGQIEHIDTRLNVCRSGFTAVYQELNHTARDPFEIERERQGEPPRIKSL
ncbi:hypothetical protein DB88DRAFT_500081 [Papiliotrema laurentii]|uniref:Nucleoporin Nup54 alpha-helical domain-containing protein n=1 Tax=Papiliotrema laurentii TaxID=5418 RepID=A0AAD9CVP3_PAPLA|nr:hypothetical protein DB88DRAFT_500081 [Papiliotrema laurentii]